MSVGGGAGKYKSITFDVGGPVWVTYTAVGSVDGIDYTSSLQPDPLSKPKPSISPRARVAIQFGVSVLALLSFSWLWGIGTALVAAYAVLVHEAGHLWAAQRFGCKTEGMFLVPFIGGGALIDGFDKVDPRLRIMILLAGPLVGLVAAFPFLSIWTLTRDPIVLGFAEIIIVINATNLLPVPPLDGGRIALAAARIGHIRMALGIAFLAIGLLAGSCGMSGGYAGHLF